MKTQRITMSHPGKPGMKSRNNVSGAAVQWRPTAIGRKGCPDPLLSQPTSPAGQAATMKRVPIKLDDGTDQNKSASQRAGLHKYPLSQVCVGGTDLASDRWLKEEDGLTAIPTGSQIAGL
jgi:hypothetical protein